MKKKLRFIICCLLLSISLVGCAPGDEESKYITVGTREFFVISSDDFNNPWDVYVDTETKVQYLWFGSDGSRCSTMSVLVDADGKPILYEGEI